MAKIDNAVRIVEFETEYDLYSQMEKDLNDYFIGESSKCYKLKNFQLIDQNHAILYFEEDPNIIMALVNRETEENHCYYKSSALACNGMITLNNREVIGIPCYASAMKDSLVERNNAVSLIDGNMEFITESNSLSRQIQIGDSFNEFGRTYKVDNIYYKDGILHIIAEVTTNQIPVEHLAVIIDGTGKVTFLSDGSVSFKAYWSKR